MKLTKENIEEYLLLLVDDELDAVEAAEVKTYIAQHEEYQALLALYRATKPDHDEAPYVFPDKESLLRRETAAMPVGTGKLRIWKQAAVVALFVGVGLALAMIALRNDRVEISKSPSAVATAIQEDNNRTKEAERKIPVQQPAPLVIAGVQKAARPLATAKARREEQPTARPVARLREETIAPLAAATAPAMFAEEHVAPIGQAVDREAVPTLATARKELPEWLPVKEESLDGVNDLVSQAQELRDNIAGKAKMLKKASFVIRIGDKDVLALGR